MGIIRELFTTIKSAKEHKKKMTAYLSLPPEELVLLDDESLLEVLDMLLYIDIDYENIGSLNAEQLTVATILSYDREVQNGGLCQFFVNSSRYFAPFVASSLEKIGAAKMLSLFSSFISDNSIDVSDLESFIVYDIEEYDAQTERYPFDAFDDAYYELYESEDIETLLLEYVRSNINKIMSF